MVKSLLLLYLEVLDEYAPEDPGAPLVSRRPGLLAQARAAPGVLRPVTCGPRKLQTYFGELYISTRLGEYPQDVPT